MRGGAWRVIFLSTSALLLTSVQAQEPPGPPPNAEQGWTGAQRNTWYTLNQGSRLMPLSWMRALEQAGNQQPFLAPDHIAGFGYFPGWQGAAPGHLPLGFAVEDRGDEHLVRTRLRWYAGQRDREPWVGLTCAACHTGEIAFGRERLRVDGAPAMADFQSFVEAVDRALVATRDDEAKFDRFARAVLAGRDTPANRGSLRAALGRLIADQQQLARMNASPIRYGFARLDAFGHIFNKAAALNGTPEPVGNPAGAPVSYPFLWNVPQHDIVQWNGSVANQQLRLGAGSIDVGAIARNAGEVVGVFGDVAIPQRGSNTTQFRSSINVNNLAVAEQVFLRSLLPPAWPAMLPGIDRAAAVRGAALFQQQCTGCHRPLGRNDLTTPIHAEMSWFAFNAPPPSTGRVNLPPGTDPLMACNAFQYRAASGRLAGYSVGSHVIGPEASGVNMLTVIVRNGLIGKWRQVLDLAVTIFLGRQPSIQPGLELPVPESVEVAADYPGLPERYRQCVEDGWRGPGDRILGYKARPLTGIWATAPFLHNGSVPTLYDLLLPPAERPASFLVGTRQFDPVHVGFVTTAAEGNSFEFRTRDARGNIIWGNFNGGHDYGNARLSRQQRLDLVEYMKTL